MVGNFWAILVTAGLALVSFYSVIIVIEINKESISEDNNQKIIKTIPSINPNFLMGDEQ